MKKKKVLICKWCREPIENDKEHPTAEEDAYCPDGNYYHKSCWEDKT